MRVFHPAIPRHDLDAADDSSTRVLGATRARGDIDRVTVRFFDHEIACDLAPDEIDSLKPQTRHCPIPETSSDR